MKRVYKRFDNKGIAPALIVGGVIGLAALAGAPLIAPLTQGTAKLFATGIAGLLELLLPYVGQVFVWLGGLSANLINIFAVMNPFDNNTLAPFIWNTFKNISYVVIVFLGLYAGFMWIVGKDDQARVIIFRIIIVAFLINFTFLFAKEVFFVSFVITKNLACQFEGNSQTAAPSPCNDLGETQGSKIGTAIHTSLLSFVNPDIARNLASSLQASSNEDDLYLRIRNVFSHMIVIVLYFVYATIMFIFAGLFVGRFVMITLLVGILPLAIIAWSMPKYGNKWDEWAKNFLKWTTNIPVLLILVLIGFSIATAGMSGNFSEKFQKFSDMRIIGITSGTDNSDATAQAYAGLLRYLFIVIYYAFVINYAQSVGGGFATFGVNFAKGTYLALGGAVAMGAKLGFRAPRKALSSGLEKLGENITERTAGNKVWGALGAGGIGRALKKTGEGMSKSSSEARREEARIIADKFQGKEADLLKDIAKGKHGRLKSELIGEITEKMRPEELTVALREIGKTDKEQLKGLIGKDADKKVKASLNKKLGGVLTATSASDVAEFISERNQAKFDYKGFEEILDAAGRKSLFDPAISQAFTYLGRERRKGLGSNPHARDYLAQLLPKDAAGNLIPGSDEYKDIETGMKRAVDYRFIEEYAKKEPGDSPLQQSLQELKDKIDKIPIATDWRDHFEKNIIGTKDKTDTVASKIMSSGASDDIKKLITGGKWEDARQKIFDLDETQAPLKNDLLRYMDYLDMAKELGFDIKNIWK